MDDTFPASPAWPRWLRRCHPPVPQDPPREWIEPATGHRVVRLSDEPGTASLYFHQNPYTATGDKMVVSTPQGLATIDLATAHDRAARPAAASATSSSGARRGRRSTSRTTSCTRRTSTPGRRAKIRRASAAPDGIGLRRERRRDDARRQLRDRATRQARSRRHRRAATSPPPPPIDTRWRDAAADRIEPRGALGRAPADGALHPRRQDRRAEDRSTSRPTG